MQPSAHEMVLQAEDSPPIVNRAWAYELDESQPMETFKTKDNRLFTLAVAKKNAGQHWDMVFRVRPSAIRCESDGLGFGRADKRMALERERHTRPHFRGVRVALGMGYSRVRGITAA
jgi:hypothetical protein